MTPQEMTKKLTVMEKAVLKQRDNDAKTKYQVVSMFKYIKKLIAYQIPKPPINVSEDGQSSSALPAGRRSTVRTMWTTSTCVISAGKDGRRHPRNVRKKTKTNRAAGS